MPKSLIYNNNKLKFKEKIQKIINNSISTFKKFL
jgi:hypothetical protein